MTTPNPMLEPFVRQRFVLLTTYRRDGTPVGTPVAIAVDGERAFVHTFDTAWKLKRIHHTPEVAIARATTLGKPTGPAIRASARLIGGDEAAHAERFLVRKYPIMHGFFVPLLYRLRRNKRIYLEVTPL